MKKPTIIINKALSFIAMALLTITQTSAQTNSYTGATGGNWSISSNWTQGSTPNSSQTVLVTNGARTYIKGTTAALASNVTIGGSSGTSAIRIDSATTNSLTVGGNITLASGAGHGYLEIGENNGGKASLTLNGGTGSILNGGGGGNANIDIYNHVGTLGLSSANADNLQINNGGSASLTIGTNQTWNVGNAYIGRASANAAYAMTVEGIFNANRLDVGAGATAGTNSARLIFNSGTIGASLIQRTGTMDSEFIWNEGRIYKEGANVTAGGTANILTIRLAGTGEHVFEATAGKTNTVNTFAVLADKSGEAGTLTKRGAGTLLLAGTNTYSGITTVDSGTLIVNGFLSSSNTIVSVGATLAGSGILQAVTLQGGTLAPGNSPGLLTMISLNATYGNFNFELGAPATRGVTYDALNVSSLLTLGNNTTWTFSVHNNYAFQLNDTYDLMDWGALDASTFDSNTLQAALPDLDTANTGLTWDINSFTTNGTIGVIPEPSAASLMVLGGAVLSLLTLRKIKNL